MLPLEGEGYVTDVAYTAGFYPNLSPLAIGYVAALNGLRPPDLSGPFRYLELGCGFGRTLTTLAAANPLGEFVAVDLNPVHTEAIDRIVAAGGLTNVRVVTADFAHLPEDLGTFDFITLHGVLSWVSAGVRQQVADIARTRLAPGGLLLASYNTQPGWSHLQPIRAILRQYAALLEGDSLQRMDKAVGYLVYLRDQHARYFTENPAAAAYVEKLTTMDRRYLVHEYLHDHWSPFYFGDIAELFGGADLGFVGSLPVLTNFWDLCVAPEFYDLFRDSNDRIVLETHKDFCANTMFRWDIYTRQPQRLDGPQDRLGLPGAPQFGLVKQDTELPWTANLGVVVSTLDGPLYASLVERLQLGSATLAELVQDLAVRQFGADDVISAVDTAVALSMVEPVGGPMAPKGSVRTKGGHAVRRLDVPSAYNRAVLDAGYLGGESLALASEVTRSGQVVGDIDGAIIHELLNRGESGRVKRIDAALVARGRTLFKEGEPIADSPTRQGVISELYDTFRSSTLPELIRQGIVTRD